MPRIIGIDLGTTNSCVAVAERGAPTTLVGADGSRTTPSVVSFTPSGDASVGIPARRQAVTNPQRTVFGSKRLIGRKVNAPDVAEFAKVAPFRIVAAKNGDAWIRLPERDVSPQEISALVLEHMRRIAEVAEGEPLTQAVVTVPAYFNDAQRQATKDAGRIAGLDVRRILSEPTAAALAYGVHKRKSRQRVVVVDLGGGTFDVSVLAVDRGVFEVLAVNGDAALGGDDFDRRVASVLVDEFEKAHGVDLGADSVALGRLKEEAERAKRCLSEETTTAINLPFMARKPSGESLHIDRRLGRAELEKICAPLIARLAGPCERALADAKLEPAALDDVLLVGGMTRMPAVQAEIERIFRRRPSKGANPDEAVALGAAAHGAILAGEIDDVVLLDVSSQSLGIKVGDGSLAVIIPRNTTLPAQVKKRFATSRPNQPFVALEIYQGDAPDARDNRHLGRFVLDGLPAGAAGAVRVEVVFEIDVDGILKVAARELSTGRSSSLVVAPSGGLDAAEMERIIRAKRERANRK